MWYLLSPCLFLLHVWNFMLLMLLQKKKKVETWRRINSSFYNQTTSVFSDMPWESIDTHTGTGTHQENDMRNFSYSGGQPVKWVMEYVLQQEYNRMKPPRLPWHPSLSCQHRMEEENTSIKLLHSVQWVL